MQWPSPIPSTLSMLSIANLVIDIHRYFQSNKTSPISTLLLETLLQFSGNIVANYKVHNKLSDSWKL
jgi:hypothetical protein